ncbi:MAG: 5-(carboxyamino)imidazole ribonucleotide synthase [Methanomassiliicoccaceae archaeon]|nr:5-(carboxyamino)imidazole ribonucleotide synthase [Methanomassiliicoccaceae archaeon]
MDIIKKRIGIVGGGQLGKFMILEAKRLGFYIAVLDPAADCPASSICDEQIVTGFDDPQGYFELAKKVDVITYEFEHINASALEVLEKEGHVIYPSVASLKTIQNKHSQKKKLSENGVPVPRFAKVSNTEDIKTLGQTDNFGYPMMLKTTTGGYDGKGNMKIRNEEEIESAYKRLGGGKKELMAEEFVNFEKEISVIACRGIDGSRTIYPVAENIHSNSILDMTIVPARINEDAVSKAASIADKVMEVFEGVGTFCIELFVTKDGEIYVNEVAPRPHNSGHYTIDGCFSDQFENHIRAIVGLPFGSVRLISPAVMVNLLGKSNGAARLEGLEKAYLDPNVRVHFYGKRESEIGRKMGHFTVVDETTDGAVEKARKIKDLVRVVGT